MKRILIIDDDDAFREGLAETLTDLGHETIEATRAQQGIALICSKTPDAVFLDFRMPDLDGIEALRILTETIGAQGKALPPVIMLTAFASSQNTIEAMKLGAFDHLIKPIGRKDIERVLERALNQAAPRVPALPANEPLARQDRFLGVSESMREVQKLIGMAAASDATVLITGETGTGKEMAACALHENSSRARRPLVSVNCAAIPAELLESELFGHVKGAFSGAVADRAGRFREAAGGTLLLDEIGDMGLAMQAKILRALQEREVMPVGASRSENIDVRIVAATHHNLAKAVAEGRFREDLFYRLNVIPIHLPPLRERIADILPLGEHFLRASAVPAKSLSAEAALRLVSYPWPGNVRELRNAIERISVIARGSIVDASDLCFLDDAAAGRSAEETFYLLEGELPAAIARLERAMIVRALERSGGNRTEAARRLGIRRQLLYAKISELKIEN